jgi:hypothetical protein
VSRIAFPFLTIPDDVIVFDRFLLGTVGAPLHEVDETLENWDYARDLEVACALEMDMDAIADALQIGRTGLALDVSLHAGTGPGRIPRRSILLQRAQVCANEGSLDLRGTVRGAELSGRLLLEVRVALAQAAKGAELSPRLAGSRLWRTQHDVLLEDGGDARFPVESMRFSEVFKGRAYERAPWYLHWKPDALQSDFAATVRLYVNQDFEIFATRFVEGDADTLQAILGDVMSQMLSRIVEDDVALGILAECETGSVGHQVQQWMELVFPGQDVQQIRSRARQLPGAFRAEILAAAEVGGDR